MQYASISTCLQCPLCVEPDSALHILSVCEHSIMSTVVTEHHKIANRILLTSVSKGPLREGLASMDIGSADFLALQSLQALNT
eukprot:1144059-Pelagomonas_calceolata.AAC.3